MARPNISLMAAAEIELRRRRRLKLEMPHNILIPEEQTFTQWCEQLGREGLRVDGIPFSLENRPAMRFLYDLLPSTPEEAFRKTIVLQKCAQVGFTVMEMLYAIYVAMKWMPCKVGMYLPGRDLAAIKSSERFIPIVRTIPVAHNCLTDGKASEGNVLVRSMGDSRFHFMWTSGKTSTESIPLDVLTFDEVQEMLVEDMEKTQERLSASSIKCTLMGSTANWPEADINWWYLRGCQYRFHTSCPHCRKSFIFDDHFPACVAYNHGQIAGAPSDDYCYVCPYCQGWIADPQNGEWIADNPGAEIISAHFSQFLSPTISPREIIESFYNAKNLKNFYNRKLGKPYMDPSQVPVTMAILEECERLGMKAGLQWKKSSREAFMGVDNMGGFACAYLAERMPDGRMAVIHAEAIYGLDPWSRLDELMDDYHVVVCCCEQLPNYDSAKQFASRHVGRVFLVSSYTNIEDDMIRWGDASLSQSDRKTAEEYRDRYTLSIDQYKLMSWAMARITRKMTLFPASGELTQEIDIKGRMEKRPILRDMVWPHFTKTALVTETSEDEHKIRRKVVKVGLDPHFSFAYMLCCAAWCRAYGSATFLMPDTGKSEQRKELEKQMPGLPEKVLDILEDNTESHTCSKCLHYQDGRCMERQFRTRASDVACDWFIAK
ncbi:phage terminase large subunit family protein [Oxalobacter paraformigenes]|uniref:Phage terminase large subunit GpA ATPase domain-containing protein n=1 Tax=Oxalobacter paraformigenes TaxID=556268 RepID=C3X382_9BURK|nr:phage terminase large subunit family protein [Oxalobacter paraformigenes]EEO27668.1 hypothetical protein OFAG_00821 [Oxalobacter paraformigenes]